MPTPWKSERAIGLLVAGIACGLILPPNPGHARSSQAQSAWGGEPLEADRGGELERQIEAELRAQRRLLARIEAEESAPSTQNPIPEGNLAARADPRVAPFAPEDRILPRAIFQTESVRIKGGTWDNSHDLELLKLSLDADRDGKPEQVRYFDAKTNEMVRKELDRDYDGNIDAWHTYRNNRLSHRILDSDGDGRADIWEEYEQDRMTSRTSDRDADQVRDAFYRYTGDSLVEELHDTNNDGKIDRAIRYEQRRRVSAEEDRNHDGQMDTWITFRAAGRVELVSRIERDSKYRGKPDVFETYETDGEQSVLVMREEDVTGDGKIDITSIYENGKLVRREIADPSLVPL